MSDNPTRLLVVDDEPNIRAGLRKGLQQAVDVVHTAATGEEGWQQFAQFGHEIVITDVRLPGEMDGLALLERIAQARPETCVIVITAFGSVQLAVEAMRQGAFDFITKPLDLNVIRLQVGKALKHRRLASENRSLRKRLAEMGDVPEIIGNCRATHDMLRQIRQVARSDATVLLSGESGTGKELAARAIHDLSEREGQFITVNVGALPDTLLESELFGHEKGAFTDALHRKIGRFEAAQGGTIFLDEITETSSRSQVDLLRVIEQREVQRLGSEAAIPIDVRVISATNQDIAALVQQGEFREDLFYRLNVVPICIPPLRMRRDDIPLLVDHFLHQFCTRHRTDPKRLNAEALRVLVRYNWPGNVRQLAQLHRTARRDRGRGTDSRRPAATRDPPLHFHLGWHAGPRGGTGRAQRHPGRPGRLRLPSRTNGQDAGR